MSGWYPDPVRRFEYRFHNGAEWTADVASGGRRFVDPLPAGPPGAAATEPGGRGNGLAVAGMVCGIVAVVVAWVPFVGLLGLVCAVVGLALSIPALARSRRAGRRSFAIAGIATSACGVVLGVLGIALSVLLVRAVQRFEEPGPLDARVTRCEAAGGGDVLAEVAVRNLSDRERSYLVELDLGDGRSDWVSVDDVSAGGEGTAATRGEGPAGGEPSCRIVGVNGPVPFGLGPDAFD